MPMALRLPFVRTDGSRATRTEIADAWRAVKAREDLKRRGGLAFRDVSSLRLPPADINALVDGKLAQVDGQLARLFPRWADWPADAQLALFSWAWAVGAAAKYPRMIAFLRGGDFALAATECTINPQRGTIIERNRRNRILLQNAQRVVDDGLDPAELHWPAVLTREPATEPVLEDPPSSAPPTTQIVDFPIVHPWPPTRDDEGA